MDIKKSDRTFSKHAIAQPCFLSSFYIGKSNFFENVWLFFLKCKKLQFGHSHFLCTCLPIPSLGKSNCAITLYVALWKSTIPYSHFWKEQQKSEIVLLHFRKERQKCGCTIGHFQKEQHKVWSENHTSEKSKKCNCPLLSSPSSLSSSSSLRLSSSLSL